MIACSLPKGHLTIYAPVFITYLVRYLSGVRMLEQYKYKNRADFRLYMKETNVFCPWFYKEYKGKEKEELLKKFEE